MHNPHLAGFIFRELLNRFSHISKVAIARLHLTRYTKGQFRQSPCSGNIDKIFTSVCTSDIHLNGLIFLNDPRSCDWISHRNLQSTCVIIGCSSRNKSHLWTVFEASNPIDHLINGPISSCSNDQIKTGFCSPLCF